MDDPRDLAVYSIGHVARRTGLSQSALRKYEELGIVLPKRTRGGTRLFSENDLYWVLRVQQMFKQTRLGPTALAFILTLFPTLEIRRTFAKADCSYRNDHRVCWQVATIDEQMREVCRQCPAYLRKEMVLDFHRYLTVRLHANR